MNLQRLWCVLAIISFSMPVFAATPYQIDSFDDINNVVDPNWVETPAGSPYGNYMEQALVGGVNEVNEGTGSMKFNFPAYVAGERNDEVTRTFSTALDYSNYKDLAITLWVWTDDPNDTRRETLNSRLVEISLHDGSGRVGRFPGIASLERQLVLALKNIGWNKVIAPLRNFAWKSGVNPVDPCVVDWDDITKIVLFARTEHLGNHYAIYIDDMRLEWAPNEPNRPYQIASFDDIVDELWDETRKTGLMIQALVGGANEVNEGTGSMMIDFVNRDPFEWDVTPLLTFIPALDFTDYNDWAITMWVWSDLVREAMLREIVLWDVAGHTGRYRVPIPWTAGWNKVTARIDEFIWAVGEYGDEIAPDEAWLEAIKAIEMWTSCYEDPGNSIYLDDLRIERAVEALSEAVVYNADYAPIGTMTIDANAADWADLVDSDIIDFDLTAVPHQPCGDLHVKYRLAWDPNYLYILVEEQPGDTEATEAASQAEYTTYEMDSMYDGLSLWFDFTNNRLPGLDVHISLWLMLGLSSAAPPGPQPGLIMAWTNATWHTHDSDAVTNGSVATSGTLGSRVIEARVKWSDMDDTIDSWFRPVGGIEAAVQPGYIFGCDPRLEDREDLSGYDWDAAHGAAWFTGDLWPQEEERLPTGRDIYSVDMRLVCSAGDLDFDCDVDFVDYAQFAAEWYETDCNSINDFCNGADIIIDGDVILDDLGRFTERWLD